MVCLDAKGEMEIQIAGVTRYIGRKVEDE